MIHKGHLELSKKLKPDVIYLLGDDLKSEIKLAERDVRALPVQVIASAARAVNLAPEVRILEKSNLEDIRSFSQVVVGEDNITKDVIDKYFPENSFVFENYFLRWHQMNSVSYQPTEVVKQINDSDFREEFMRLANEEASRSSDWWRQVGAVLIQGGKVIGSGHNKHLPSENSPYIEGDPRGNFDAGQRIDLTTAQHGEAGLIAEAARKGISLEGAILYVTTFPCPTCSMLVATSGIKKVYYRDGYSLLNAAEVFKQSGVQLVQVVE